MIRTILLSLLLLAARTLFAQNGTVAGVITANEGGSVQPMPFVNVIIKGTTFGASTDLDGRYGFPCPAGEHTLLVSFVGFEPVERTITVAPGATVTMDLTLAPPSNQLQQVEVVAVRRTESESAVLLETRNSQQVVNGVGRQQIARSQDRTAGDVVKRIPGVTILGDRFVMIRGLADRYNAVMLNDVSAPSLEPDKRAFSFDLIPSGALERIMVYKTAAPDLPGEFAGGVVKVHTLTVPAENETRVSLSTSMRAGTTFQPFLQSDGSPTDALGFDNGSRQLPDAFPATLNGQSAEALQAYGRALPNNWTARERTAMPDARLGLLIARTIGRPEGNNRYGTVTSIDYANTWLSYTARNYNYNAYDLSAGRSDTIYDYRDQENIRSARMTVMHNWTALLGKGTKLELRNLFNQQGQEQTTFRTGRNMEEGFAVRNYAFRYQQRTVYSGQLHGDHTLGDRDHTTWTLGYGLARSKEPDFRRVRTTRDIAATDGDTPYQIVIPPSASTLDAGRFFSDLCENVLTGRIDHRHRFADAEAALVPELTAGVFVEDKEREFSARWMSFSQANLLTFDQSLLTTDLSTVFSAANINPVTGFELTEGTNPSDRYTARNTLLAGYLGASLARTDKWTVSGGVRVEHNRQQLQSARFGGQRVRVDNPILSILPSVSASYDITERSLVRVAWGNTVNRPEFRELAPFAFYDFSLNNVLFGNDSLEIARVMSVDARWELYPTANEVVSVGVFYKRFRDPIEMYFVPGTGSGGTRNFTFDNAVEANSFGVEAEVRRSFSGWFGDGYLGRFGVLFNGAYILTQVDLGARAVGQAQQRPLMGQSPYVLNAGLFYQDTEHGFQYNIQYNIMGRRLFAVGTFGTPDLYEMPRHQVDATLTKRLGRRFELKASVQDLLNQRVLLIQDSNADERIDAKDEEIMSFRRGQVFSLGLNVRF
ncbi:MAG: TonB-dependent receptor [Flavobacteriales bacterium]|nr:TonB-dependent receptor [Flavobacteriales bacterium]